ncbi:MAG: AarF/UbiB family protein, partial [Candidatus Promineifilaceae bacterium]|nr:AarF/UbiB family protein [Candidatus Promineifilaceae bacterium]
MTTATQLDPANLDRRRYRKILWFFGGAIARIIWWDLLLARIFLFRARVRGSRPERFRRLARRFRDLAVEMGGVMIKLGQFFSSRVDVLPPEITEELAGLQDEVPPVPMVAIQEVLAAELGDVSRHFDVFETEPLAAASLGQAHRARLATLAGASDGSPNSNRESVGPMVIVKVQRPNIEDTVRTDLAALNVVARWVMRYPPIRRRADVPALMDEFAATLWEELDYELEADNAEHFGRLFSDDPNVVVPAVHREHSTGRVLVLQDVTGIKITDFEALDRAGIDRSQVAMRLLDAYFRMIFKEGFFHADPHPGNLFVLPVLGRGGGDGQPFRLAFVDFGMVGHIEELMGENLRKVLVSVTQRDARSLTEAYDDLGFFLPNADLERITEAQARV